ncbi:MAG: phytanoyl-CoA dioxygenase family protein [Flavobacteriales bacterium]|nr:phytanoyl-CoA dioxygenase family protein [Flavobacteriales bacterium]
MSDEEGAIYSYGVTEITTSADTISLHAEEIKVKGFTIIPDILSFDEVELAKTKVHSVYETQLNELNKEVFDSIGDYDIARALLVYDEFFLKKIVCNPTLISLLTATLGKQFIIKEQNAIINRAHSPNYQLKWHRDLLYQHFIISRPLAISALFCLEDFTEINGGTFVLPGSHKTEKFPSEFYIKANEQCVNAPKGSAIVFDSMLYHRAGRNVSDNNRIGINNMFVQPFMKQAISFPKMLNGKYNDDRFLNKLLGYSTETDESVVDWRNERFSRIAKKQ